MLNSRGLVISTGLALVLAASAVHADGSKHTLADLKALISQNAFKEAFEHLGDIPPAQRGADWLEVAGAACGGVLGTLNADDGTPLAVIDEIDRDYPQVLKSAKYTRPRAELGVKGIDGCFNQAYEADSCLAFALRFVDNSKGDRDVTLKVAKSVRRGTNGAPAIPFFKRALAAKDHAAVCKDEDLSLALIAGLGLPADSANVADAKAIMTTCWDTVKGAVVDAFDHDTADSYFHHNTCPFLISKKLLSPLQTKQCARK